MGGTFVALFCTGFGKQKRAFHVTIAGTTGISKTMLIRPRLLCSYMVLDVVIKHELHASDEKQSRYLIQSTKQKAATLRPPRARSFSKIIFDINSQLKFQLGSNYNIREIKQKQRSTVLPYLVSPSSFSMKPLHSSEVSSFVLAEVTIVTLKPRMCSNISKWSSNSGENSQNSVSMKNFTVFSRMSAREFNMDITVSILTKKLYIACPRRTVGCAKTVLPSLSAPINGLVREDFLALAKGSIFASLNL